MFQKLLVIMGPTGAGKSGLALRVAKRHHGEIINADSRQIYAGMDIGTDKVGSEPKLVTVVPHHLIDILTPDQRYSAAEFRDDARRIIAAIHARGHLPIVVGGTGFYIRVLTGAQELSNVPSDQAFRAWAEKQPLAALVTELRERSPALYAKVDNLRNRRRVTRYLEIARARGNNAPGPAPYPPLPTSERMFKIALTPPADVLGSRIEARVDRMLRQGLLDEVRGLVERYGVSAPGLQTPGYRQALSFVTEQISLAETRRALVRAHRETARRQLVWLKKEPGITVAEDVASAEHLVDQFLSTQ